MRATRIFLALLPMFSKITAADFADSPQCALPCIREATTQTACAPTDQTCLCRNPSFIKSLDPCVYANCTVKEAFTTKNLTWTTCDFPTHNDFSSVKIPRIILFVLLPTLSLILRMAVKISRVSSWGPDDTTILLAYATLIVLWPTHIYAEKNGVGRDVWTLSFKQINHFFLSLYIHEILYNLCITLIKASILFMFLRIFPGERFRVVVWATQVFNLMTGIAFVFVSIFQCQPLNLAWTHWSGEHQGKCVDMPYVGIVQGGISVAVDIWMLTLPAIQVWDLNIKRRKRFAAISMFSLGLFLTVVSIIRIKLVVMVYTLGWPNPTFDSLHASIWTDIELYVGIFTTCIPNVRQFFCHFIFRPSREVERLGSAQAHDRRLEDTPKSQSTPATETAEKPT